MKKLKKFLVTGVAVLMMATSLVGCTATPDQDSTKENTHRFMEIYSQMDDIYGDVRIIVDRETGVMYLINDISYGGGITVMVDEEGKPLIWEGETK